MLTAFPVSGPTRYDKIIYQDKVIHNIGDSHRYYDSCADEKTITVEELLDATITHHPDEIIDIFSSLLQKIIRIILEVIMKRKLFLSIVIKIF